MNVLSEGRANWRWQAFVVSIAAVLSLISSSTSAAPPLQPTSRCTQCHFPLAGEPGMAALGEGTAPFCHREEAVIWREGDKHRQSMFLLLNDQHRPLTNQILGFDIAEVLEFKLQTETYRAAGSASERSVPIVKAVRYLKNADPEKAATVRQCLACHAPIEEPVSLDDPATVTLEFGISCQACHGPGGLYEAPHSQPFWRLVDPAVKQEKLGLVDLRNPYRRARQCASCHVGSWADDAPPGLPRETRFVRHEWYALGHPPLPGFEYVTFSTQMPAHWRTLREKAAEPKPFLYLQNPAPEVVAQQRDRQTAFVRGFLSPYDIGAESLAANYLAANRASLSSEQLAEVLQDQPRSRDVLIAGLAVMDVYAALLRGAPSEQSADFALFDCGACHHELRSKFPSEARVRRGLQPGRPPAGYWTLAIARLAAQHAAASAGDAPLASGSASEPRTGRQWNDAMEQAVARLDQALSARPFGDREQVRAAAEDLREACEAMGLALATRPFSQADAERLLAQLVDPRRDEDRDYHAARQSAWAIRETLKDLAGVPFRSDLLGKNIGAMPPAHQVPGRVMAALGGSSTVAVMSDDPRVVKRIDTLFGTDAWWGPLRLRLPAGQQETIVGNLESALEAISTYDAEAFRTRLVPLRAQYPLELPKP